MIDQRIKDYVRATIRPDAVYRLQSCQWRDPAEAHDLHHIYVDVRDAAGHRIVGAPVTLFWPGGATVGHVEEKPGEPFGANFPMNGTLGSYGIWVGTDRDKSDEVNGMGLGTPQEPTVYHHTAFGLVFVKGTTPAPEPEPRPEPEPKPEPSPDLDALRALLLEIRAKIDQALAIAEGLP